MNVSAYQASSIGVSAGFAFLPLLRISWNLQGDPLQAFGVLVSALSPDLVKDLRDQPSARMERATTYLSHQ